MVKEKTLNNLKDAFAGESQANRKYLAFAQKADEEGFKQAAKLFRAAADAETVHAHNHLRAMEGIKSTSENLKEAVEGETYEFEDMYPSMIEAAKQEGENDAMASFNYAHKVEKIHAQLYKKYLDNLGENEDTEIYVCQYCGNTVEGEVPDKCPICGRPREIFNKIE